ncbi:putative juvenile hormone binding protein in insects [Trypoxylus dichotomus]
MVKNANIAIPELVKGEIKFNWPPLSSIFISKLELPGPVFDVTLTNVRLDGLQNIRMTDVSFSLENTRHTASFETPLYFLTADYTIQVAGIILGGGKMAIGLEQNTLQYNWDLRQIERDGEIYLRYDNASLPLKTKRISYNFKDLYISDGVNVGDFISKHKEIVEYRIRPAVEQVGLDFFQNIVDNLLDRVPLKDIFDP